MLQIQESSNDCEVFLFWCCLHLVIKKKHKISYNMALTLSCLQTKSGQQICDILKQKYMNKLKLKTYSQISYRWRSQKFFKFEFFASICSSPLRSKFSKRNWAEIISLWNESHFWHKVLLRRLNFNTVVDPGLEPGTCRMLGEGPGLYARRAV